ncbi:hypothetical protein [Streptomyces sp. SD15]
MRGALVGFLGLVERWTARDVPAALAAAVVAKLDEGLAVSAPR